MPLCLPAFLLQHGTVNDVLAVYNHQQQYYGFASTAVQTSVIHALLKAHSKAAPGNLLAYEAWVQLKTSGRQLDAQALLAGMCIQCSFLQASPRENSMVRSSFLSASTNILSHDLKQHPHSIASPQKAWIYDDGFPFVAAHQQQ